MKLPFSWLKDYVDVQMSAQEVAEKLFAQSREEAENRLARYRKLAQNGPTNEEKV